MLKTKLKIDSLEDFEDAVDLAFNLTCARFNVDKIALEQSQVLFTFLKQFFGMYEAFVEVNSEAEPDSTLDSEEFARLLTSPKWQALKIDIPEKDIKKLFEMIDTNSSNNIEFTELITYSSNIKVHSISKFVDDVVSTFSDLLGFTKDKDTTSEES